MTYDKIILGTSPFIFSPQFGHRTRLYELDFENQPENIAKILDKSFDMGIDTIMLNRSVDLEKALDLSIQNGNDWNVYGFTKCGDILKDIEVFQRYNTSTVVLDGFFVDEQINEGDFGKILEILRIIRERGFVPAIETRRPFKNLPIIKDSIIIDEFDALMIPFNFYGYMMDCNFLNNENKKIINDLLYDIDKEIIANRTLATGILKPQEAYEFISNVEAINSVCVGVAKEVEAEETFGIINKFKS